ncbi:hypothetical protein FRC12_002650 [Ceratobasidium sp. 428]|nr:hypothetical protein FRC12_002650 [Ceratobasidium sp. 428]
MLEDSPMSTPETELEFDYHLAHPFPPPSNLVRCPGCERTLARSTVTCHRRRGCGGLKSARSRQVIRCRLCNNQVTRYVARKHMWIGCRAEDREELRGYFLYRLRVRHWILHLQDLDDF